MHLTADAIDEEPLFVCADFFVCAGFFVCANFFSNQLL